jgi:hypothetical protein
MKPRTEGIPNPERPGSLDQDKECGLEGILRVVRVDKLRATNAQYHRAVALDQGLESRLGDLTATRRKPLQ